MFDFLIVVKDNAIAITTLVGVFTIIGGFIGAHFKNKREKEKYELERQKIEADKKSLRQQMITNNIAPMRQAWINDLRNSIAEYLSDVYFIYVYETSDEGEGKKELKNEWMRRNISYMERFNYIYLLLPFSRENKKEETADSLRDSLFKLNNMIGDSKETSETDINTEIKNARDLTKKLLKEEWDETQSLKEVK